MCGPQHSQKRPLAGKPRATENSKTLKFDANGLIPAIVQDHYTKEVLTLAYMNAETLALTIAEGRTVFWSRSRREIWRKGETSGNVQRVVSITADCDKDALVIDVIKNGPACHTGAESCFFNPVYVSDELKQFTWKRSLKRSARNPPRSLSQALNATGRRPSTRSAT